MKYIHKLLFILIILFVPVYSFGQTDYSYQQMKSMNAFSAIKARVVDLLKENAALEEQKSFLEKEYYSAYKKVTELKKEIDDMVSYSWEAVGKKNSRDGREKELKEEFKKLQDELLVKKARNSSLKGFDIDSSDSKKLWELQVSEMNYHIRELEMDLELKERLFQEKSDKFNKEIDGLDKTLNEKKSSLEQIDSDIAMLEKQVKDAPGEIEALRKKHDDAEKIVSDLRIEKDILEKRNLISENQRKIDSLAFENEMAKKQRQKDKLKEEVIVLKAQYDSLDKILKESLMSQDRNKKMIELIKEYDLENQELKKKISTLNKELNN